MARALLVRWLVLQTLGKGFGEMKKTLLTGIAALLLTTGAAHADGLLPPKKYDYLFPGPIVITRKSTPEELAPVCGGQKFLGGCAVRIAYVCQIFLLDDEWLERFGLTYKTALRHEIGHCNGWGADHAGDWSPELGEEEWPDPYELQPDQIFEGPFRFLELGKRRLKEMENK